MFSADEIIAMAKETIGDYSANDYWPFFTEELQKFAALVAEKAAAREREACAQVCDASVKEWLRLDGLHHELTEAQMLADEIRARGTKEGA